MSRVLATMESSVRSRLVLRAALLSAACALSLAPARAGQEAGQGAKPTEMLGGAVTFTLPEAWRTPSYQGTSIVGLLQTTALYPVEEGKEPGEERNVIAVITMSAFVEDDPTFWKQRSDSFHRTPVPGPQYPGLVMLNDTFHGVNWRTLALKGTRRDGPYLALSRSGMVGKKFVFLSVMLPADVDDPKPLKSAIKDFNAMCESLKIDGKNQLDTKLNANKILEVLGVGEKK
jgi:hypothetical protein